MKTNFVEWANHYQEILNHYFNKFNTFLENNNEPKITFNEFIIFCYNNTKKNTLYLPGIYGRELRAPLV